MEKNEKKITKPFETEEGEQNQDDPMNCAIAVDIPETTEAQTEIDGNTEVEPAGKRKKKSNSAKALVALLLAAVVFIVLLAVERAGTEPPPEKSVVVASHTVPQSMEITKANVGQYFVMESINADTAPATAYESPEALIGMITATSFSKNEIATNSRFRAATVEDLRDPVEVSLSVASASYADGGRIRAGDKVHIGFVSKKDDTAAYTEILNNVFVVSAMDSSGVSAVSADDGVITTLFSVALSKRDAQTLYDQIELGNVVLQKVTE